MKIPLGTRWLGSFWDGVIKIARGKIGDKGTLSVRELARYLSRIELNSSSLRLIRQGKSFDLPVGISIRGLGCIDPVKITQIEAVYKTPDGIRIEANMHRYSVKSYVH